MTKYNVVCPCLLGAEGLVAEELRNMSLSEVKAENGRVSFTGDMQMIARANINSRYSERILIEMGSFYADSFEALFEGTKALPWADIIGRNNAFPVKGRSVGSKLTSIPDCQAIIKKAIVEKLKLSYKTDWFTETDATIQVQFLIMKDKVSIMLDTSGPGLHKRGYRKTSTEAPIKETLAAMMVKLARVRDDATFYDPFCGSGTILIEAATYAYNIAPGLKRRFAAQQWSKSSLWETEQERAKDLIKRSASFQAFGSDIDSEAVNLSLANIKKAGVSNKIEVVKRDIADFDRNTQYGCVICNPPYGERLLDLHSARALYKTMGEVFESQRGWSYTIISPDEEFEKIFGRTADRRRKLYNGMLKCQVFMYYK